MSPRHFTKAIYGPYYLSSQHYINAVPNTPQTKFENSHQLEALDIGELSAGPLSTVVSLTGENLAITRVGAVTLEALRKVAPTIELANQ